MASSKKIPRRKKIIPTFLAELSSCKLWRQTFISSYRPFPKQWKNSQLNLKSTRNEFFSWSFQQRFIFLLQSWRKEKNRAMDATNPFPQKRSLAVKIIGNKSENCSCFRSRKIASEEYFVRKPSGACLIFSAFFSFPKKKVFIFVRETVVGSWPLRNAHDLWHLPLFLFAKVASTAGGGDTSVPLKNPCQK